MWALHHAFRPLSKSTRAGDGSTARQSDIPAWAQMGRWWRWPAALGITALCTLIALPLYSILSPVNLVMLYLLGATVAGLRLGRAASVLCVLGNVAAFDYFFVRPYYTFYVAEPQDLVTLASLMLVALVIANLMVSLRRETEAVAARERRTAMLYAMSRELAGTADAASIATAAVPHIAAAVEGEAAIVLVAEDAQAGPAGAPIGERTIIDRTIIEWVARHQRPAGRGTPNSAQSPCLHLPLAGGAGVNAVVVVRAADGAGLPPHMRVLLDALAGQAALAFERARLAKVAAASRAAAERAALRNALLASISHDLRAPLTAIAGAGCLVAQADGIDPVRRQTLGQLIEAKARDMSELLNNVLELIRLESATAPPRADWQSLEELVGAALRQTAHRHPCLKVVCDIPADLPMLHVDGLLIRQLLSNLFENSAKASPQHVSLLVRAAALEEDVQVTIEDDGPGFGAADPERLFEKFERGHKEGHGGGAGLGLSICRAIAQLHGGSIYAMNRLAGGARIELLLPVARAQPVRELREALS